jgi:hypothetical protein
MLRDARSGARGVTRRELLTGARPAPRKPVVTTTPTPPNVDIRVLQTASSVERAIVSAYEGLLALPLVRNGRPVLTDVLRTTLGHHNEHLEAFQARTVALGGKAQAAPNPKVQAATARGLGNALDVVKLAVALEQLATDTYLFDLGVAGGGLRGLLGSVMLAEAQHLSMMRIMHALVETGKERLVALPTDLSELPMSIGAAGFPRGVHPVPGPDAVASPDSGAVR